MKTDPNITLTLAYSGNLMQQGMDNLVIEMGRQLPKQYKIFLE